VKLDRVHIDRYGGLKDITIDLADGFQVLHGPNEAGKTTFLAFIRGVLFNFKHALLHLGKKSAPYFTQGETMGGYIEVTTDLDGTEHSFRISRSVTSKQEGDLKITSLDDVGEYTNGQAETLLTRILRNADAQLFSNVFMVSLDELRSVEYLSSDEMGVILFSANAGVGISLHSELTQVKEAMDGIFVSSSSRKKQRLKEVIKEIKDLERDLRDLTKATAALKDRREESDSNQERIRELRGQDSRLQAGGRLAAIRVSARELLETRRSLLERRVDPGERTYPTEGDIASLRTLEEDVVGLEDRLARLQLEAGTLRERHDSLAVDEGVADICPVVNRMVFKDLPERILEHGEYREAERKLEGLPGPLKTEGIALRLDRVEDRIRDLGPELETARARLEEAKDDLETASSEITDPDLEARTESFLRKELKNLARERDGMEREVSDARSALTSACSLRSIDPEDIPDMDDRAIGHVRGTLTSGPTVITDANTPKLLPMGVVAVVAGSLAMGLMGEFLAGSMLMAFGGMLIYLGRPVHDASPGGEGIARPLRREDITILHQLGLSEDVGVDRFDTAVEEFSKIRQARAELDRVQGRLSRRDADIQSLLQEAMGLFTEFGVEPPADDPGAVHTRLETLQRDRISASAGIERRKEAVEQARRHLREVEERKRATDSELQEVLGILGQQDIASARERLSSDADHRRWTSVMDSTRRSHDLVEGVLEQLNGILQGLDRPTVLVNVLDASLTSLQEEATRASSAREERDNMARRLEEMERDIQEETSQVDRLVERRDAARARFGIPSADEGQEYIALGREQAQIGEDLRHVDRELERIRSGYPDLEKDLEDNGPLEDQTLIDTLDAQRVAIEAEIERIDQMDREVFAEVKALEQDDSMSRKRTRRTRLDAERQQLVEQWAELFLTRLIMETSREIYEGDTKDPVLGQADGYLSTMTGGRYISIARTVEEPRYEIKRDTGGVVTPTIPSISQATFVQVYLSIRLAYLKEKRTEHGKHPLLMDDALSDFDDERMRRTVEVFAELGETEQIVLLTHHDTVAGAARDAGATIIPMDRVA